ncbi:MAG: DUF6600 domain-containing protein [Polyangiaceae bacterium]
MRLSKSVGINIKGQVVERTGKLHMHAVRLRCALSLSFAFAAAGASALSACEPDAPPATPQNASTDVPPPPPPAPPPTDQTEAAGSDGTMYASGEVAVGENADAYDDDDPSALTDFHATLDPYGTWVDDGTYGTVWVPAPATVGADFTPYTTAGHWAYDDDWVWVSDYPWGWAPFHYGRWIFIEGRGWSWVPGRVYRGAWVSWAVDPDYAYIGWAPLWPAFIWFGGRPVMWHGHYGGPRWVYCSRDVVFTEHVGTRVVTGTAAASFSGRMHRFVPASPTATGPAPGRLGYKAQQIPHMGGATAQGLSHAQAFARPSTAQPLGGSAPSRSLATAHTTPATAGPRLNATQPAPVQRGGTFTNGATQPRQGTMPPQSHAAPRTYNPPTPYSPPPPSHSSGGGHHR